MRQSFVMGLEGRRLLSGQAGIVPVTGVANQVVGPITGVAPVTAAAVGGAGGAGGVLTAYALGGQLHGVISTDAGVVTFPDAVISPAGQYVDQYSPLGATTDSDGNGVVVYGVRGSGSGDDLYVIRVDANGAIVGAAGQVGSNLEAGGPVPGVAAGPDGELGILDVATVGSSAVVMGTIVDGSNAALLAPTQLNAAGAGTARIFSGLAPFYSGTGHQWLGAWTQEDLASSFTPLDRTIDDAAFSPAGATAPNVIQTAVTSDAATDVFGTHLLFCSGPADGDVSVFFADNHYGAKSQSYPAEGSDIDFIALNRGSGTVSTFQATPILHADSDVQDLPVGAVTSGGDWGLCYLRGQWNGSFTPSSVDNVVVRATPGDTFSAVYSGSTLSVSSGDAASLKDPVILPTYIVIPSSSFTSNQTSVLGLQTHFVAPTDSGGGGGGGDGGTTASPGKSVVATDGSGNQAVIKVTSTDKSTTVGVVANSDGSTSISVKKANGKTKVTVLPKGKGGFNLKDFISDGPVGTVSAPNVNIGGNIELNGVSSLTVGNVKDDHIISLGSVAGAVIKLGSVAGADLTATGSIKSLAATDWMGGSIAVGGLGGLAVKGNFDADITADVVGTVAISGTLGGTSTSDRRAIVATTSIGAVTAAKLQDVNLFAGVNAGVTALPAAAGDFAGAGGSIKSIAVKGKGTLFSDVNIAAPSIGSLALGGIVPANPTPFGIAAEQVGSYKDGKVKRSKVTTADILEQQGEFVARTV